MPKQKHFMNPAAHIVEQMGGCRPLAKALEINPSTISRWMTSSVKKGTDGRIPQKYWGPIIIAAQNLGKTITPQDLFSL